MAEIAGRMEFHVSSAARDHYQFDLSLFSSSGNVIFANFSAARAFAQKMNAKRDLVRHPEQAVSAAKLNAMGLIDEMLHVVVEEYRKQNSQVMQRALATLEAAVGTAGLEKALRTFASEFPAVAVYRKELDLETYLAGSTQGRANREIVLEEMLMLWMANANPAFSSFLELFDDSKLELQTPYLPIIHQLEVFLENEPGFVAAGGLSLFKVLRMPALAHPDSLEAQLELLMSRFGGVLGRYMFRVLTSLDVIKEAGRSFAVAPGPTGPGGGGTSQASAYGFDWKAQRAEYEPEAFSPDLHWMPRLVLLAKNAFVWLDQLSKKYGRTIRTLDQVPDEELDMLADWGITGLWLIGVWERSRASKEIKLRMGNPDAVASAYSLYDYVVAGDLGGEAALDVLRQKASRRGIRMASDMVPNHVGIDGRWVIQHPDWFISLPYPPYPGYSFNGPDLSNDPRVGIFIEDHYYDKTDAAVVFKRLDRWTGSEQYIYHGNDGTALPWNDTAQLNYLNPEVREAVIQTILHVARQFPVIRFDAAMTLAKRHIQRLWFPLPGGSPWGASIPSRAEHAMSQEQFDAAIPVEFWREVVDRVAVEAPETLLLAEAFWMMEGYFVRSLGMHRVYNSAFMNMLRDEKNAEYRSIMKNTMEFEPEILRRFVNFLNNPDEKTAVEQFGKGDKYFGIVTLCATMPGLPMVGHGQVEGYSEKYGMEYQRAYYDETPDQGLVDYHYQQIFPLFKRRPIFAEVENFLLYDCANRDGSINEDVFAYSNRFGSERSFVVYHNKHAETRVWVRTSVEQPVKIGAGRELRRRNLGEGLDLTHDPQTWSIFRDSVTGLEYIRNSLELREKGLYLELGPYQRHVFLDWLEVYDPWGEYAKLAEYLGGRGVQSIEETRREIFLKPIHVPFRELVNASMFRKLIEAGQQGKPDTALLDEVEEKLLELYKGIDQYSTTRVQLAPVKVVRKRLEAILQLNTGKAAPQAQELRVRPGADPGAWAVLLGWLFTYGLGNAQQSRSHLDEWRLGRIIEQSLQELGLSHEEAQRAVGVVKLLVAKQETIRRDPHAQELLPVVERWSQDTEVQAALHFNRFQNVLYFNREAYEALLVSLLQLGAADALAKDDAEKRSLAWYGLLEPLHRVGVESGYQVEEFLKLARGGLDAKKPARKTAKSTAAKKPHKAEVSETSRKTKAAEEKPAQKPAKVEAAEKAPGKAKAKVSTKASKIAKTTEKSTAKAKAKKPAKVRAEKSKAADDLTLIEGIGPKIKAALQEAGIDSFKALAKAKPADLRGALEAAGIRLAPSLKTWAKQAAFLAKGDQKGLEAYTKKLVAGREP